MVQAHANFQYQSRQDNNRSQAGELSLQIVFQNLIGIRSGTYILFGCNSHSAKRTPTVKVRPNNEHFVGETADADQSLLWGKSSSPSCFPFESSARIREFDQVPPAQGTFLAFRRDKVVQKNQGIPRTNATKTKTVQHCFVANSGATVWKYNGYALV